MKKFSVNYTETYTGQVEIEAESKDEAMEKVCHRIDCEELIPSQVYDRHEITVGCTEEVKNERN